MSDDIKIEPEYKDRPAVRKLARALLLLAEAKAAEARTAAKRQWAEQYDKKQSTDGQEPAA